MSLATEREHRRREGIRGVRHALWILVGVCAYGLVRWAAPEQVLWGLVGPPIQRWEYLKRFEAQYADLIRCLDTYVPQATRDDYETVCEPCRSELEGMSAKAPIAVNVWFRLDSHEQDGHSLLPLDWSAGTPTFEAVPSAGGVLVRTWDILDRTGLEYMRRLDTDPDHLQGYSILIWKDDLE